MCVCFKDFINLFVRDTEREGETQAEGEAGSLQEARRGTRSRVPRITPWAEGSTKALSHRAALALGLAQRPEMESHVGSVLSVESA